MRDKHIVTNDPLTIEMTRQIVESNKKLELSKESILRIEECRDYLDMKISTTDEPIYDAIKHGAE